MSLSDPGGDSAVFEWLDGKLAIHHGRKHRVLTNSPTYDEQLAIGKYWRGVDPLTFLVGAIPTKLDPNTITAVPGARYETQAVAAVLGVMRAVSTPLGVKHPTRPSISSTLWRTVHDQTHRIVLFDSATSPNAFWVPLAELDFSAGAPVKKLTLAGGKVYAGNAAREFVPAQPFAFSSAADL